MLHVEACKHAHQRTIVLQPTALLAHSSLPGCGTKQGPFALLMYNDMLVIFEINSVLVPGVLRSDVARRTVGCPKPEVVNHLTKLRTGSAFLNTTSSANLCDLCARCARFSRSLSALLKFIFSHSVLVCWGTDVLPVPFAPLGVNQVKY